MTVETTTTSVELEGNGSAREFSFSPITVYDATQLEVVLRDTDGTLTTLELGTGATKYSVVATFVENEAATGSVRYPDSGGTLLAAGQFLSIRRVVPKKQESHFENQGGYLPKVQEMAHDLHTMGLLELSEELSRAVKVPFGSDEVAEDYLTTIGGYASTASSAASAADNAKTAAEAAASIFTDVSVLEYGAVANEPSFDNGPAFQDALDATVGTGSRVIVPVGNWYFQTGFQLNSDNRMVGASMLYTNLIAVNPTTICTLNNNASGGGGFSCFGMTGADYTDSDSKGIRIATGGGTSPSNQANNTVDISNIYFKGGFYDEIIAEQESDLSRIDRIESRGNVGRSRLWADWRASNGTATTACAKVSRWHATIIDTAVVGANLYGIYLQGNDAGLVENCIMNGHDANFVAAAKDNSSTKLSYAPTFKNCHSEDFRPFIGDPSAWAALTSISVGDHRIPTTPNGYIYECTTAGTTNSSEPTWPTTIGQTVSDGTAVWTCLAKHSRRWQASVSVGLGEYRKPTKLNATGWIYECTTAGTTGSSEPTWPESYGATVSDGTAVWTAVCRSVAFANIGEGRTAKIEGCQIIANLCQFLIQGGVHLSVENCDSIPGTYNDSDVALRFKNNGDGRPAYASFKNSVIRGNVKPYDASVGDSTRCNLILDHTTVANESLGIVATSGDGVYSGYSGMSFPVNGGVTNPTADFTVDLNKDKFMDCNNTGDITVTLPAPNQLHRGKIFTIRANNTGKVTVSLPSSITFRGASTSSFILNRAGDYIKLRATASTYVIDSMPRPCRIVLRHVEAGGTDAGTFTSGAWQTRPITTESTDEGNLCTLSSNQFTLLPGQYSIVASSTGYMCGLHQLKLRNITDGSDVLQGSVASSDTTVSVQTESRIAGSFTITASKTFELQHRCQTTRATDGMGKAANFGVGEVYAQIEMERMLG